MKKSFSWIFSALFGLVMAAFAVFVVSCEIGLGSAVDTEPPAIEILTPAVDAIIRDSFAISGNWSDDGKIKEITVELKRTDGKGEKSTYLLSQEQVTMTGAAAGQGDWTCVLNPTDSQEPIIDGSYLATVIIRDASGRETRATQQFTIDNTPPIVVLQRPGSKKESDPNDTDEYGQVFSLEGQSADDNNLSHIDIYIYSSEDCDDINPKVIQLNNVPPTISLDAATFVDGEVNDYSDIYGSTSKKEGAETRWCKIVAYDNAQRYPADGSKQKAEDTKGNSTSTYYLYDDVAEILSEHKITEIYKMASGVYGLENSSRSALSIEEIVNNFAAKSNAIGKFKLNPVNNPVFTIVGKEPLKKDGKDFTDRGSDNAISNNSEVVIEVSTGLDGHLLNKDELRPYILPCDDDGNVSDSNATHRIYLAPAGTGTKSGTSYKFTVKLTSGMESAAGDKLATGDGNNYVFGVEGTDAKNNPVMPKEKAYGFNFVASGAAPELTNVKVKVNNLAASDSSILYVPKTVPESTETSKLIITGNVKVEEGTLDSGGFTLQIDDSAPVDISGDLSGSNGQFTFSHTIDGSVFGDVSSQHTITIKAKKGLTASATKTIMWDCEGPEIDIQSITPIAYKYTDEKGTKETDSDGKEKEYVNGKINIKVSVVDTWDSLSSTKPVIEFLKADGTPVNELTSEITNPANFTVKDVDTTKLPDGSAKIKITAYDRAGNKTVKEQEILVDQRTDKPVILPGDDSTTTLTFDTEDALKAQSEKNLFQKNGALTLKIIDDDGIDEVKVQIENKADSEKTYPYTSKPGEVTVSYTLPDLVGIYKIKVSVKDKNEKEETKNFYTRVIAAAPTVSATIDKTYITTNKNIAGQTPVVIENPVNIIIGTINIDSDVTPFKINRIIKKDGSDDDIAATGKEAAADKVVTASTNDKDFTDTFTPAGTYTTGSYTLSYEVLDANKKVGNSVSRKFNVDNTAPIVNEIKTPTVNETDGETASYKFEISATDAGGSGVEKYYIAFADLNVEGTTESNKTDFYPLDGSVNTYKIQFQDANNEDKIKKVFESEGKKRVFAYAVDGVGNKGAEFSVDFDYDKASPEVTIDSYTPENGNSTSLTGTSFNIGKKFKLSGTAIDGNKLSSITIYQKAETDEDYVKIKTYTNPSNGTWELDNLPRKSTSVETHELSTGVYSYKVQAKDVVGKTAEEKSVSVTIDLSAPTITILTPDSNSLLSGTASVLSGKVQDVGTVGVKEIYYAVTNSASAPDEAVTDTTVWTSLAKKTAGTASAEWQVPITLKTGKGTSSLVNGLYEDEFYLYVKAIDNADNLTATATSLHFYVDQAAPEISEVSYKDGEADAVSLNETKTTYYNSSKTKVTITGKTTDSNGINTLTVNDEAVDSILEGVWKKELSISENTDIAIKIVAKDFAGRSTTKTYTIHRDTKAPVVEITNPDSNISGSNSLGGSTYTFRGSASDAGSGVKEIKYLITETPLADDDTIISSSKQTNTESDDYRAGWTTVASNNISVQKTLGEGKNASSADKIYEGQHYLYLYSVDKSGNESVDKRSFWVDKRNPELKETTVGVTVVNVKKGGSVLLKGTASDTNGITSITITDNLSDNKWFWKNQPASGETNAITKTGDEWSITIPAGSGTDKLCDGEHTLTITAVDGASKESMLTRSVNIDTIEPSTTGLSVTTNVDWKQGSGDAAKSWFKNTSVSIKLSDVEDKKSTAIKDSQNNIIVPAYASGIVSVEYSTDEISWIGLTKNANDSDWTGNIYCSKQGANTISVRIKDAVGNITSDSKTVYIDTVKPAEPTAWKVDGVDNYNATKLVNGRNAVSVQITVADGVAQGVSDSEALNTITGINRIVYEDQTLDCTQSASPWTLSIPAGKAKTGEAKFVIYDNAGNSTEWKPFSFAVDTSAPKGEITPLKDADSSDKDNPKTQVNGTITLEGTAKDVGSAGLAFIDLCYYKDSSWTFVERLSGDSLSNWTSSEIDTTKFSDNTTLTFCAIISDTAGNRNLDTKSDPTVTDNTDEVKDGAIVIGRIPSITPDSIASEYKKEVVISQDTDRPIIRFSNLDLSKQNISLKNSGKIFGTISDDDGIDSFKYKDGKNGSFETISVENGSFEIALDDGPHDLYFYVKDKGITGNTEDENRAIGTVFQTKETADSAAKTPKFTDGTTSITTGNMNLQMLVDQTSPVGQSYKYAVGYFNTEKNKNEYSTFTNDYSTLVFGGSKQFLAIKLEASDANGISSITASVKDKNGETQTVTGACADATYNDTEFHEWLLEDIPLTASGFVDVTVTITDGANLTKNERITLSVDNTAPTVEFSAPSALSISSGDVMAYGTVTEISKMRYALSLDGVNAPSTTAGSKNSKWSGYSVGENDVKTPLTDQTLLDNKEYSVEYTEIINPSLSWYIYFDGITTDQTRTNGPLLKNWLVDSFVTTTAALQAQDGTQFKHLVNLYLWVEATDSVGNTSETVHPICIDPQGDRPSITIDYPETGLSIGGTIRLSGSVEDNTGIDSVWVQVISNAHNNNGTQDISTFGTFTKNSNNEITAFNVTANDVSWMKNHTSADVYKIEKPAAGSSLTAWNIDTPDTANAADYAVKAHVSGSSWNLKINNALEYNPSSGTNDVAIRVYAVDLDGNRSYSATKYFKIDTSSPIISNVMLKQFADGVKAAQVKGGSVSPIAEQEYSAGVFVKGNWYLTFTATDDGSIGAIKRVETNNAENPISTDYYTLSSDNKTVNVFYPLVPEDGTTVGEYKFAFKIEDENTPNPNTSTCAIELGYDNEPPKLRRTGSAYSISPDVKQSNGFYTLKSQVDESVEGATPSGLKAVAFYFVRRYKNSQGNINKVSIFDPMQIRTNSVEVTSAAQLADSSENGVVYDSGLYWLKRSITRDNNNTSTLTYTSIDASKNDEASIHIGGLVQIKGVLYTIIDIEEKNSIQNIILDKNIPDGVSTACFALGMVVDTSIENVRDETKDADGYYQTFAVGDKDRMYESISGTTAQPYWEAQIVSRNIPDGTIEIHYVAFDKAGNYSIGIVGNTSWDTYKAYTTPDAVEVKTKTLATTGNYASFVYDYDSSKPAYVSNNAPRIVGVTVKTDYNGNSTYDDNEKLTKYYSSTTNNNEEVAIGVTDFFIASDNKKSDGKGFFTLKDKTQIEFEIIGGNGSLKYDYNISDVTESNGTLTSNYVAPADIRSWTRADFTTSVSGNYDNYDSGIDSLSAITKNKPVIDMAVTDFTSHKNSTIEKPTWFTYRIWDSTDGTTQYVDSQKAIVQLALANQVNDVVNPNVVVNKFHWNSKDDNSVYWVNGKAQGHIELENDLPSAFTEGGTGINDKDPKVSGIIVIDGWVWDNIRLSSITAKFENHFGFKKAGTDPVEYEDKVVANYSNGTWTENYKLANLGTNGFAFVIDSSSTSTTDETKNTFTNENGHKVLWKCYIDTSKIAEIADADKSFTISAKDMRGLVGTTASGLTSSSTKVGSESDSYTTYNNPSYKMDVVPYITGIKTTNRQKSGLKDNNIRSASGKYSVIVGTEENFMKVEGFNLNPTYARIVGESKKLEATITTGEGLTVGTIDTTDYKSVGLKNDGKKSGYLELFVNGIRTLNNINNNDSHGSFVLTGGTEGERVAVVSDYENMPNREADYNITKNVQLTDDRYIRFFDMKQTDVQNGYYPVMIMEEDNPVFGYVDKNGGPNTAVGTGANTGAGSSYPSHAMPQRGKFDGSSGEEIYKEYLIKASTWDSMGMARDDDGRFYNVSVYNRDGAAMTLVYDRYAELQTNGQGWGAGTNYGDIYTAARVSHSYQNNAITLDSVNYGGVLGTERYQYPKLITKGGSITNAATVYMAYYDERLKQICFRNFKVGKDNTAVGTGTGNKYKLATSGADQKSRNYTQCTNMEENYVNGSGTSTFANNADAKTWSFGRQTAVNNGSEFFSMAVNKDNYVFIIYYDKAESKLRLYKSSKAVDGSDPNNTAATKLTWMEVNVIINNSSSAGFPEYVGGYVSMDIDSNDGLHIAASDVNDSDLSYIYIPSNNGVYSAGTHITVDQFGAVGNWTQIKVKNNIPYIGYVNATENGQRDAIKIAYATSVANASQPGVEAATRYTTGNWEYMTVPAITPPQSGDSKFQSVCLDFDSSGTPVVGYLGDYLEFGKWLSE